MEGYSGMIKNYAPQLHKNYEEGFYKSAMPSSDKKGLFKRPSNKATMVTSNEPKDLMQEYFNSVRKKREEFNDTI